MCMVFVRYTPLWATKRKTTGNSYCQDKKFYIMYFLIIALQRNLPIINTYLLSTPAILIIDTVVYIYGIIQILMNLAQIYGPETYCQLFFGQREVNGQQNQLVTKLGKQSTEQGDRRRGQGARVVTPPSARTLCTCNANAMPPLAINLIPDHSKFCNACCIQTYSSQCLCVCTVNICSVACQIQL